MKRYRVLVKDSDGWVLPDVEFDNLEEAKRFAVKNVPVSIADRPRVFDTQSEEFYQYDGFGVWV